MSWTRIGKPVRINSRTRVPCRCDCGKESMVMQRERTGELATVCCRRCNATSNKTKHGHASGGCISRTYNSWASMIQRCENEDFCRYRLWGGKGVKVCVRWHDFSSFLADMGERPIGKTLDRFPNKSGNYEPGNCRWATPKQQANNLTTNRLLTIGSRTMTMSEWAESCGISGDTIQARLRRGWSEDDAVNRPVENRGQA
jgi:hypothetical protein